MNLNDDTPNRCSYCAHIIEDDDFLPCIECRNCVHIKCLRHASTPGDLLGDVFFDFTCATCVQQQNTGPSTSAGAMTMPREKFKRQRLPWVMVITMTLYNLSIKSKGISHHGYFHWRTHIVSFIDKNWDYLFDSTTRRRKKWIGSVSGALSHNSPDFFLSGQEVFNETGWWKLTYTNQTPKFIFKLYEQMSLRRQQLRNEKRATEDSNYASDLSNSASDLLENKRMRRCADSDDDLQYSCSRTIPYMGRKPKLAKQLNIIDDDISKNLQQQQQQPLNAVQTHLMDFLAESLASDDLSMFNNLSNIAPEPLIGGGKNDFLPLMDAQHENANFFGVADVKEEPLCGLSNGKLNGDYAAAEQATGNDLQHNAPYTPSEFSSNDDNDSNEDDEDDDAEHQPRIVQVTNFQQPEHNTNTSTAKPSNSNSPLHAEEHEIKRVIKREVSNEFEETIPTDEEGDYKNGDALSAPTKQSLFNKQPRRNWPWLVQKSTEAAAQLNDLDADDLPTNEHIVPMSEYEERQLLQKLQKIFALEMKCQLEIPTYIRRFYRKLCVREWKREHARPQFNLDDYFNAKQRVKQQEARIIDRYQLISLTTQDVRKSFYARIAGATQHELFESPYTQRVLHPFIYRSKSCFPTWLKLMCEIQYAVNGTAPTRAPIDYCYVRPNHIAAVNALLQTVFWPGIDMSECLSYPDFSVVALYKKLVVGCGFLVPDVGFNEAYISFMAVRPGWQRSGIATFMLYHLIQTCMSKDITLHVSATNPAVVLYQKFGFKIEEVILDFYEKYLPIDSKHSRHAFFLRLMR